MFTPYLTTYRVPPDLRARCRTAAAIAVAATQGGRLVDFSPTSPPKERFLPVSSIRMSFWSSSGSPAALPPNREEILVSFARSGRRTSQGKEESGALGRRGLRPDAAAVPRDYASGSRQPQAATRERPCRGETHEGAERAAGKRRVESDAVVAHAIHPASFGVVRGADPDPGLGTSGAVFPGIAQQILYDLLQQRRIAAGPQAFLDTDFDGNLRPGQSALLRDGSKTDTYGGFVSA